MSDALLLGALVEAQERKLLGPGPVVAHVEHARRLVPVLPERGMGIDLGSGGGVPALVFAHDRPQMTWVLVESQARRAAWLREALQWVRLESAEVREERAELTGRGDLRGVAAVVTARSFANPGITAECGAPLLSDGGVLWVSEPPSPDPARWPVEPLSTLGLERLPTSPPSWVGLRHVGACPPRYPRRVGIPGKRPLF